ncbi:pyrroline-5-carboxylate reductase [Gynurincola endophyticus]|uniref:pyrroline-5-carboxylate reductase n=1 Tax=Gynurincola endophyticus TaxID=2479004 RepID=UPI000F8EB454|nr:pyrroline-5-carboxylate reductase [Gynurincola endophyticus]
MNQNIAIIGGGNLGASIAEGLIESAYVQPQQLMVTKRNLNTLKALADKGVKVSINNQDALAFAHIIIVAIKPFQMQEVLGGLKELFTPQHVVVSVVTGYSIPQIKTLVGTVPAVVRAMPNTAIAIQESMTCLAAAGVDETNKTFIEGMFQQLGEVVWIDEQLMDAATVLAACATAYAMRYIRANIQGGIQIGFDAKTASQIAAQTVKGAAELLLQKNTHPEAEIDKVTTPKGCTIAGLNEMEHQGFSSSLIKGIVASYDKISKG